MSVALVTDSNAQLPPDLALRYSTIVVPMIVTIDGVDHQEGIDIDADSFYARFTKGTPDVRTSQPSPGSFAAAYRRAERNGATAVLSIHIGSAMSGTINSARLGASMVDVPVTIVDTASASFAVSCCVWEAGEALRRGATIDEAAARAEATARVVDSVFIVGAGDLARRGGRFAGTLGAAPDEMLEGQAISVIGFSNNAMRVVGTARSADEAVAIMAQTVVASPAARRGPLRVGLSIADAGAAPLYEGLATLLSAASDVAELVRYRVGPSVGAHTGPGTAGAVWYPIS